MECALQNPDCFRMTLQLQASTSLYFNVTSNTFDIHADKSFRNQISKFSILLNIADNINSKKFNHFITALHCL